MLQKSKRISCKDSVFWIARDLVASRESCFALKHVCAVPVIGKLETVCSRDLEHLICWRMYSPILLVMTFFWNIDSSPHWKAYTAYSDRKDNLYTLGSDWKTLTPLISTGGICVTYSGNAVYISGLSMILIYNVCAHDVPTVVKLPSWNHWDPCQRK